MQTLTLRPNSDALIELSRNTGSYNYSCVDETGGGNGDTDYVYSATLGWKRDLYGMPDHTSETGAILELRIYVRHKRVGNYTAIARGRTAIKTNGIEYFGSEILLPLSYELANTNYAVNPQTGLPWTWFEIDALQAGWSGYAFAAGPYWDEPYCTQVWVEVDHTIPAPGNVGSTKGTYTDKVTVTWDKVIGANAYQVYRDGIPLGWLGDVATYDDTGAAAPVITPGSSIATDGEYTDKIALALSGTEVNNGTAHTYVVHAKDSSSNESGDSEEDTGYRGHGALTFQWQRSAADSDASYSNITGATTWDYDDTNPPGGFPIIAEVSKSISQGTFKKFVRLNIEALVETVGRYYKCILDATGCAQQTSVSDRGYLSSAGVGPLKYQWQRQEDNTHFYVGGGTTQTVRKYLKSDLSYIGETANYGGAIQSISIDDIHIYVGGWTTQTVRKYLKSDFSYIGETASYGGSIYSIVIDDTYIYVGGGTTQTVRKYLKSDLSYVGETASYGGIIQEIHIDDTHIYVGGVITYKVRKYLKSDLSYLGETASYGGIIYSIVIDDTHIYVGGDITYKVRKYLKSDLSYVGETASYGGNIYSIVIDDTHIYVGGSTTQTVRKYLKSDLSYIGETASYGGSIYSIFIDDTHIYVGGSTTQTVRKYLKSDLSYVGETASYGGIIFAIYNEEKWADIEGAIFASHDDYDAPAYPEVDYYRCFVIASSASGWISISARGFVKNALAPRNSVVVIIKNPTGETLSYTKNLSKPGYDYRINELGTCTFSLPADSPARDYLIYPNEAWLYIDGELKDIFKIIVTKRTR